MIDPKPRDFDEPVGSEARFRTAIAAVAPADADVLRTQFAHALGLQARFGDAFAVLDGIVSPLPEVAVRVLLESTRSRRPWPSGGEGLTPGHHDRALDGRRSGRGTHELIAILLVLGERVPQGHHQSPRRRPRRPQSSGDASDHGRG